MKHLKELRQSVADLKKQGREKTDEYNTLAAKAEKAELGEEEQAKLAALESEIEKLEERTEAAQAELDKAEAANRRKKLFAEPEAPRPSGRNPARSYGTNEPSPERCFGFRSLGEFAGAVQKASAGRTVDDRLQQFAAPSNFHQEAGGDAGEGYLVPPQFREEIYDLVFSEPDIFTMVDTEPTRSNHVKMIRDETTPWGSTGITANWRAEGTQMSADKLAQKEVGVDLHELYVFALATEELLEDAPRLGDRLTRKAADAIRWKASDAVVYGNGVGKPEGYFESAALVTQAKESGQSADTITAANVLKMYARQLNPARSVWLANVDILPQLGTMTIGDQPVWTPPSSGITGAPGGFILGRPLIFTEHAKTLGDKGDLHFVDLMGYYSPQKAGGIRFADSLHLYFDYNMRAFRWTFRMGGRPYLSSPVSPANGSNTKSHFVVLAERA
ncbi:phage major capsid protein [Marinicauda algicola]|uniref:Phage major capsid protein n=1 Tax=Marinicauda algicola TaxID=2029849 RepID=A0A4S2GWT4_9PROT|nr:phage major capsid protein [Marinicauda algicola]TGY87348.1 phage major capsid protein [Marinicauda algicola]